MAAKQGIELEKSTQELLKLFKTGTTIEKLSSNILTSIVNKMVYGEKEEQKIIFKTLIPEVLSANEAIKIIEIIKSHKELEQNQIKEVMDTFDKPILKEKTKPQETKEQINS